MAYITFNESSSNYPSLYDLYDIQSAKNELVNCITRFSVKNDIGLSLHTEKINSNSNGKITTTVPINFHSNNINIYITFDKNKIYSVKTKFLKTSGWNKKGELSGNEHMMEIPGAKELLNKYRK
jgi:hypothetical protein